MPHTLFISDLHLGAEQSHITQLFLRFLQRIAPKAEALYILGDLFEYWAGDDDLDAPLHRQITSALNTLATNNTRLFIMCGNRDFLMAGELAAACHATLLSDPTLLDLYGTPTLLTHGDMLCTDDAAYQDFRQQVRGDEWQQRFLSQPLAQRKAQIAQMRTMSASEKQRKTMSIMDVNEEAVAALLREHGYPRLIHGHTHRPGRALYHLDGHTCERWILGDWDKRGNALHCAGQECRPIELD
ncbi:MAG: UDP-2,3-diacylglucosamine diphosphatase [Nitrosomonadales bacterium]|nr:UDP-2,3-diacylglucosamine diphosphatase [Nitrosomonadales bacterium]